MAQELKNTPQSVSKVKKKNPVLKLTISDNVINLLGFEATKFITSADNVEMYLIDSFKDTNTIENTDKHIMGYKILAKSQKIDSDTITVLKHILLNPSSYYWDDFAKSCVFTPSVATVFKNIKTKDSLTILYCFQCDEWQFIYKGKTVKEDLDLARKSLLNIFKSTFKENQTLQNL